MGLKSIYIFCVVCFFQSSILIGQGENYIFQIEEFSANFPELNTHISKVYEDRRGLMWIATEDGLYSYDGYDLEKYDEGKKKPFQLTHFAVQDICEDKQGRLLIATRNGLNIWDFEKETSESLFSRNDSLFQSKGYYKNKIFQVFSEGDTIWVNEGGQILKMTPDGHTRIQPEIIQNIDLLYRDQSGYLWAFSPEPEHFIIHPNGEIIEHYNFYSEDILINHHHNIRDDLIFNEIVYTPNPESQPFIYESLIHINLALNNEENATYQFGPIEGNYLHNIRVNTDLTLFKTPDFISVKDILWPSGRKRFFFNPPLVWAIGNNDSKRLFKIQITPQYFETIPDLKGHSARGMYEDENGHLYIGTYSGLFVYNPDTQETELFKDFVGITNIYPLSNDRLFLIGDGTNFRIIDKKDKTILKNWHITTEGNYFHLLREKDKTFWISGRVNLFVLDENLNHQPFTLPSGEIPFLNSVVTTLFIDNQGFIWVAVNEGLYKCSKEKGILKAYDSKSEVGKVFSNSNIHTIYEDEKENFWLASVKGLFYFNPKTEKIEKHLTTENGLPHDNIYSILPQGDSVLWLGTHLGLSSFHLQTQKFWNYFEKDGLSHNEFNRKSYFKSEDGTMWFGGVSGITFFDPEKVQRSTNDFRTFIPKILQHNNNDQEIKEYLFPEHYSSDLVLEPQDKFIEFFFASDDYSNPRGNQFSYQLEGYDKDWMMTAKNQVRYTNLDNGDYVFRVKTKNDVGIWSTNTVEIEFTVLSPFYEKTWFWILMAAGIIGIVVAFYQYRLKKQNELMNFRQKIANDLHDDISNSLNLIRIAAKEAQIMAPAEMKQDLDQISQMSKEATENMQDAIWSIDTKFNTIGDTINKMLDYTDDYLRANSVKVKVNIDERFDRSLQLPFLIRRNFLLIFKESLSNILKHTHSTEVRIDFEWFENGFIMKIENTFDKLKSTPFSTGRGLENMKRRATQIDGKLETYQTENTFTVLFKRFM